MRPVDFRSFLTALATTFLMGGIAATAQADPISPTYTITDLGTGNISLSTASGNTIPVSNAYANSPIVSVSNGQTAYAFPVTPATVLVPGQGAMANFPSIQSAPVADTLAYGNPNNAFSTVTSAIENANGIVAAMDYAGTNGHDGTGEAYYVQQTGNGTWSAPVGIWGGDTQNFQNLTHGGLSVVGINKLNEILGTMGTNYGPNTTDTVLYNIATHTLTDFTASGILANYSDPTPIAIDDQGRILLQATSFSTTAGISEHTLLLTPAGVSSVPVPMSAPEPGSWAVMALAMAGFVAHRVRAAVRPCPPRGTPTK